MNNWGQFGAILAQLPNNPAPQIPALDAIWQWNDVTGNPIFPDPQQEWRRFVPSSMRSKAFSNTAVGQDFLAGMMDGQRQSFTLHFNQNPGQNSDTERSLLAWILGGDLKKLRVQRLTGRLFVTKTNAPLIPYDPPGGIYPWQPIRTTVQGTGGTRPSNDLATEINLNGERGFMGPGTFRCRHPLCTVSGPCMTQSSVVRWGPGLNQVVNLRKRFSCASTNVTYLLYCQACLNLGQWSSYIGETNQAEGNVHRRLGLHVCLLANQANRQRYPTPAAIQARVNQIMALPPGPDRDPEELMRDPYCHFNFIHQPADRRYAFLDGGFASTTERRGNEYLSTVQCGNFTYNADNFTGSLNHETLD